VGRQNIEERNEGKALVKLPGPEKAVYINPTDASARAVPAKHQGIKLSIVDLQKADPAEGQEGNSGDYYFDSLMTDVEQILYSKYGTFCKSGQI